MRKKLPNQTFDAVDVFILRNWWVMCVPGLENEPGLRAWGSKAVVKLLEHLQIYRAPATPILSREKWYHKRCRKVGLYPFRPSYVLDVNRKADGKWTVKKANPYITLRNGERVGDLRDVHHAWRVIK